MKAKKTTSKIKIQCKNKTTIMRIFMIKIKDTKNIKENKINATKIMKITHMINIRTKD